MFMDKSTPAVVGPVALLKLHEPLGFSRAKRNRYMTGVQKSNRSMHSRKIQLLLCAFMLFVRAPAVGQDATAIVFVPAPPGFVDVLGSELLVHNLPRPEYAGVLPFCTGSSASFLLQHYACRVDGVSACASIGEARQISALSAVAWAEKSAAAKPDSVPTSYRTIRAGGAGVNILLNSARAFQFKPNSCYALGQMRSRFASDADYQRRSRALELLFEQSKQGAPCASCLIQAVGNDFGVMLSNPGLARALQRVSFPEFVYAVLFPDCATTIVGYPPPDIEIFPKVDQHDALPADLLPVVLSHLRMDRPVQLERICLVKNPNGACTSSGAHAVVIVGAKRTCRGELCVDLVKIQNFWSEKWQSDFDGGWVRADALMKAVIDLPMQPGTLSWIN